MNVMVLFTGVLALLCEVQSPEPKELKDFLKQVEETKWTDPRNAFPAWAFERGESPVRIKRDKDGQIRELRVDGVELHPNDIGLIVRLDHLQKLDLRHSTITDDQLKKLRSLPDLQFIALSDTEITDEGVRALDKFPKLRSACLFRINASAESIRWLRAQKKIQIGYSHAPPEAGARSVSGDQKK